MVHVQTSMTCGQLQGHGNVVEGFLDCCCRVARECCVVAKGIPIGFKLVAM